MRSVHTQPPGALWERLQDVFGANWENTVVTFGEDVHSKRPLAPELVPHEEVHVEQQLAYDGGPEAWWERYIADECFRYTQEVPAFQAQYAWIMANVKDRNYRARRIATIASELAGPLYGNMVTVAVARKELEKGVVHTKAS